MNKSMTLLSFSAERIAPIVSAVVLAATGSTAFASPQGQAAINAEVARIPTVKPGTTIANLKSADALLALCLALENPANAGLTPADLAVSALEARKDKDKLASSVIGTTLATIGAGGDAAVASAVTAAVFSQAGLNPKKGQPAALAGGLTAITDPAIGKNIGSAVAAAFNGSSTDLESLLVGTAKVTGKSTSVVAPALANLIDGLFAANEVPAGNRATFIAAAAQKVAASNPPAAGAFYGGLVLNNPNDAFDSNGELQTLATGVIADKKLAKAIGEILGNSLGGHSDKAALTATLIAGQKLPNQSLIVQGILRAGATADAAGVLGAVLPAITKSSDRVKFAGVIAVGNGDDSAKLVAIVGIVAGGQPISDKSKIGITMINSIGTSDPDSAQDAMGALIDSAGGVGGDALGFGLTVVPKIKSLAAAGAAAAEVAERNGNALNSAAQLMAKAGKAATDIVQRISALGIAGNKATFALQLANLSPKFVQSIAVGTSINDPANSPLITANVVTHNPTGDKAALAKVGIIAGAVAFVVDEENAAGVAGALGALMSDGGKTAGKPIKIQSAASLATSVAKAIQTKPGVATANRMDELGELAAVLTSAVIAAILNDKSRAKAITAIGKAIGGVLSKKAVNETKTLPADTSEARDIAGSMALVVSISTLTADQKAALIGPDVKKGAIGKGVLAKAGKKTGADYLAAVAALEEVRDNPGAAATKFETGSVTDKETDTKNG